MKKVGVNDITANQFMYILIGTMIGTGVLSLPNNMAKGAKQDGWISVIIALWYPLYVVILGIYISKKYPNEDILKVNKKCFGNFIGSLLSLLFTLQFLIGLLSVSAGFSNVSRVYIVDFLTPSKIISVILILGLYGTFQGLKVVGRISEVSYYFLIALLFVPLIVLRDGSVLNISPVFGSGIKKIVQTSNNAIFAYSGIEIIFLIYPYVTEKKEIAKRAVTGVLVTAAIYTYVTFMTIFYMGPDAILQAFWSVMVINETVNLPFINSFRFIFMFFWSLMIFKTIVNQYYSFTYGLSNSTFKFRVQKVCFFIYPFLLVLTIKYGNEISRRNLLEKLNPIIICFNLIYLTLLGIIVHFKKVNKNEIS
ncbi:GerAB/ArcD/ProY family transporter [Candidatus Clostridium radicumherbarum]|uniref:GerAB/ArcD/ProY family transporter n=1 Tax=Candidatus Clostridium radicumherbarum TaxID=3381662 RepID=A0ABW8TU18_9CLOT